MRRSRRGHPEGSGGADDGHGAQSRGWGGRDDADCGGHQSRAHAASVKEAGLWIVGADAEAPKLAHDTDLSGPVALVMGAEGSGLRQLTRDTCDLTVRLPQQGAVESLNVSVASGMLLYEALRQRLSGKKGK